MRVRRIFSALLMIFVLLLSTSLPVAAKSNSLLENSTTTFTGIEFVSNIETIGLAVSGTGLPPTAELSYRQSGEPLWHSGHQLMRIDDGRLLGSLFNLSPATTYDVRVLDGASEIHGSVSTQPDELSFTASLILHVDDNALPGGNGSTAAPFQSIQEAVNQAGPGTQVLVADGIYREAVTIPNSGTEGNWIQVKAAGNAAILDGADRLSGNIWTLSSTSKVWFTRINGPVAYLARDGKRYYQYDDRNGLMQAVGHGGVTIKEGWFYEPSTLRLYVRSLDDPANHTWQVPRLNHAFDVAARNWIWIEGFEMQFYGTTTNGCGVCTINTSHIVIRRNKIHNMQLGIFINWTGTEDQGNDTRIEQNDVYDPLVNEWPWTAVKGSFMEGTGIIIRGHTGAIVRDNNVHNFFNGIYTGSSGALENPELAFDADIYRNTIHHISDDALEPEGACINQRFRNNTVDSSFIGISLAPITQGPAWVLRSTFTNFTGRGIKFANNSDGIVLIYQNTGWTNAANVNGADLITPIHNVVMRNNIFQTAAYSFAEVPTGSTANDWNHDNWYTTRGSTGPHFKWENVNYNTISALCTASGLECDGYEDLPGFTNPTGGDFTLLSSSPNIDRGVVLPGINDDFIGNAPDVGAYEFGFDHPIVSSSVRANANPTDAANVNFTVTFSKSVTGVDISDFALTTAGVTTAAITSVSGSGTTYSVTVNTGSGNGTLRLDVVDDDSIRDISNMPLGGAGTGNGAFSTGESYDILKTALISGNVGITGTQLQYTDGTPKAVVADGNGGYTITVPYHWAGTVTASHPCYSFIPVSLNYDDVTAHQTSQDYIPTFNPGSGCAKINVDIGGINRGNYGVPPQGSQRVTYPLDSGPVKLYSTNAVPIIAALRDAYLVGGQVESFAQLMGLPKEQLSDTYYFPAYNNVTLDGQLRFANVDSVATTVTVTIGGVDRGTYPLQPNQSQRVNYALDTGPVVIKSSNGAKIIAALRDAYLAGGQVESFVQLMGLPKEQLSDTYYFPAYNNLTLDGQLRFGNVDSIATDVTVTIGGMDRGTYTLQPNQSHRESYPLDTGPVVIKSSNGARIIAALRDAFLVNGKVESFAQLMGLPLPALSDTYVFPAYNNLTLDGQLRFGNVDSITTDVTITIGGVDRGTYPLQPNQSHRVNYPLDSGPVVITSSNGASIIAALRDAYIVNGQVVSFVQLMGLPQAALSDIYYFPAYNNLTLSGQLRFGVP